MYLFSRFCMLHYSYGGEKKLFGPGLTAQRLSGIKVTGGIHTFRMHRTCFAITEEREMELYSAFRVTSSSELNQNTARITFSREQCIEKGYCTGDENEIWYMNSATVTETKKTWKNKMDTKKKKKKKNIIKHEL